MQAIVSPLDIEESIRTGTRRRAAGQFYTNENLVRYCLEQTGWSAERKILLDPACGTGNFLLGALATTKKKIDALPLLHGWDIDGKAVSIARFLLLIGCSTELREIANGKSYA